MKLISEKCHKDCKYQEWYFTNKNGLREWIIGCYEHTPEKILPMPKFIKKLSDIPKIGTTQE